MGFGFTLAILVIPLAMFLLLGLAGHKMKPATAGILGTLGLGISFVLSLLTAYLYFFASHAEAGFKPIIPLVFEWMRFTPTLQIDLGILLDPISIMMLVVVTTISFMVHIYSNGYMKGDDGFQRFFAFLSLFTFSMLGLVVATNLFQMYIFWELVGLSSYLLIGYYYTKPSAVAASKKAFIVTRFADLGFLVGILIVSYLTGTFDFAELTDPSGPAFTEGKGILFLGMSTMSWALIFIFMGGAGKSAMFPLHIWLPDAMEGPTPVSALIHAATMVVAGVYLVARLFPVFAIAAPDAKEIVSYVGAFTALFAATVACTQFDIKRVLAYSTMSQIGYMMLALGVSGYGGEEGLGFMASNFHLFTHAMFKALLFLGAGSIIHAVHSNDMREMGGLKKYMPITFTTFLIGWLAISGFPGLSGFFSKDEILVAAFNHNKIIFFTAVLVAGMTAFYMSRLFFSVFFGKEQHYHHAPHESPKTMTIPLMVLAFASLFGGFIPFHNLVTSDGMHFETEFHWNIAIPVTLFAFAGIALAYVLYYKPSTKSDKIVATLKGFHKAAYNKFYIDEIYMFVTKKILFGLISAPIAWFDRQIVDGSMNAIGYITAFTSEKIKKLQSGQVQKYGFVFVSGVIALMLVFVYLYSE